MTECKVCGRTLRNEESISAGVGPKCRHAKEIVKLPDFYQQREIIREEEYRIFDPERNYSEVFRFAGVPLAQLRRDLLQALSAGNKLCLTRAENDRREVNAIRNAIDRATAYGGASLQIVAMLAVVAIEEMTKGKEPIDEVKTY
jgi:hypothetical protein